MKNNNIINRGKLETSSTNEAALDNEQLKQLLLDLTEQNVLVKVTDEFLDKENEKIKLVGGRIINLREIKENLDKFISNLASDYTKRFPQNFYDEIFRLNEWIMPKNKTLRPYIVGRYTNEIIYMRFSKEGLLKLQNLNPFIEFGIRKFKHFQLLSEEGKSMLDQFIFESVECMEQCTTWYEFRLKYGEKYKLNVQLKIFEKKQYLKIISN